MRDEKFKTVSSDDPEIDTTKIPVKTFIEWARNRTDLSVIAHAFTAARPTIFNIREIPRAVWALVDGASSDEEKYRRAFMYGVESAENVLQRNGTRLASVGGSKTLANGNTQHDSFTESDLAYFWPDEIQEIGKVAYDHSFFHPKKESVFRLPHTLRLRLEERDFLSVAASHTSPGLPNSESSESGAG